MSFLVSCSGGGGGAALGRISENVVSTTTKKENKVLFFLNGEMFGGKCYMNISPLIVIGL